MLHQLSLIEHADSKQKTPQPMYWLRRFLMVSALGVLLRCRSRLLDPLLPQYPSGPLTKPHLQKSRRIVRSSGRLHLLRRNF